MVLVACVGFFFVQSFLHKIQNLILSLLLGSGTQLCQKQSKINMQDTAQKPRKNLWGDIIGLFFFSWFGQDIRICFTYADVECQFKTAAT